MTNQTSPSNGTSGITKTQLVSRLAEKTTAYDAKSIDLGVSKIVAFLTDSLKSGQRIEIRGFGSFNLQYRAPHEARNPRTGNKVTTKAKYSLRFKAGKNLREVVDKSKDNK